MAETTKIAAIILAAGRSERMRYPKPLLVFGKETAVDRVVRLCRESRCDPVIVVLGHDENRVRANASLEGAVVVLNPAHESGRTSSLQAGLRALPPGISAFVLFPVDHAMVESATIAAIVSAHSGSQHSIVVPVHAGRRGHPALFDASLIPEFLALGPDVPARTVTNADAERVHLFETADAEVLRNMDTPSDYHDALEVYSARGGEAGFLAPKGAGRPAPKRPPV